MFWRFSRKNKDSKVSTSGNTIRHRVAQHNKQMSALAVLSATPRISFYYLWACQDETDETAKIMIELSTKYGIDLNVRDNNGKTPLHWACWNWNNPVEVRSLTENGFHWSNIVINDREHQVTKYHTEQRVQTEIVTMLLEYWRESGIDIIKAQDNEGQTALDWINLRLQWKNDDLELNKVKTILEEEYAKIDAAEV